MLNVLALMPDFINKPSGGLGEQFRYMQKHLGSRIKYHTVSYPERGITGDYNPVCMPLAHGHAALMTIIGQSVYFQQGIQFNNIDVVHAYDWSTFYAGVLASWHLKKPLVCTVQLSLELLNKVGIYYCGDPNSYDGKSINDIQLLMEKLGLYYANHIVHVSKQYESNFLEYKAKSSVIYNGIDLKEWVKKADPILPGKNKHKLCYIGRASPQKGLDVILDCAIPNDVDFYFVVSNKSAQEPIFTNIKKKCNNINIFHIPGLYGQEKIDFLYAMDSVVMPSIHEPFGIVALEALISENILMTTAVDGIAEIVESVDYLKITSSYSLLQAINRLKNMKAEEKQTIIDKGKYRAQQFDWKNMADKLYVVYKNVAGQQYNSNDAIKLFYDQKKA